jgi:hypothetical protein
MLTDTAPPELGALLGAEALAVVELELGAALVLELDLLLEPQPANTSRMPARARGERRFMHGRLPA